MRYRAHFKYSREFNAESIEEAERRAEWLRVGIGTYVVGRFDPKIRVEFVKVEPADENL